MAWNTEATRRCLREAARTEFAAHGFDGTTMTSIADRAGMNKERLYSYFGDKRTLWNLVLAEELKQLAASVRVACADLDDVGEFAGATFDYHATHPELTRLLQWEGLQDGRPADEASRTVHYREKVKQVAAAQLDGRLDATLDPGHLLFALIALAAWWQTVPQLAAMITGVASHAPEAAVQRRAFVVEAARRLAGPR